MPRRLNHRSEAYVDQSPSVPTTIAAQPGAVIEQLKGDADLVVDATTYTYSGSPLLLFFNYEKAEYFLAVGPGVGGLVIAGRERFDMALVMVGVLVLSLVGFTLNRLAYALEAHLLRWRPGQTA